MYRDSTVAEPDFYQNHNRNIENTTNKKYVLWNVYLPNASTHIR